MTFLNPIRSALRPMLVLILGTIAGCAIDTPPRIAVEGIRCVTISEQDPRAASFGIDLALTNTTDEPIRLDDFSYVLAIGNPNAPQGKWEGTWSALRTIPAHETVRMSIPGAISSTTPWNNDLLPTSHWSVSGTISYKAPGRFAQILFDSGLRHPKHDFASAGSGIAINAKR